MRALSIRQPWAHLIIHGGKRIENRSWNTKHRGPIFIHVAKGCTILEFSEACDFVHSLRDNAASRVLKSAWSAPRMGIAARANLVDVVTESSDPWFFGPFGFVLEDVEPLPFRPCKGALGFFEVPE